MPMRLRSVTITLEFEKRAPHQLEMRPAVPVQNKDLLLKLLNLKLQADPPQAGILGVTLSAEPAVPQVSQRGLFQAQFPESGQARPAPRASQVDCRRGERRLTCTVATAIVMTNSGWDRSNQLPGGTERTT